MIDATQQRSAPVVPFWGRVTVVESPVDESQRDSGLILPSNYREEEEVDVRRGVVLAVDHGYWDANPHASEYVHRIDSGTVVFFTGGIRIGDAWVIQIHEIIGFEEG